MLKIKTPIWTEKEIASAKWATDKYEFAACVLTLIAIPLISFGMVVRFLYTLNRLHLFLFGNALCLALLFGFGTMNYLAYYGVSINFVGIHINITRILPPTCEAATLILGPGLNMPCQLKELQVWGYLALSADGRRQLLEAEVPSVLTGRYGIFVLCSLVAGYVAATSRVFHVWCHACERHCSAAEIQVVGMEHRRCKTCCDLGRGIAADPLAEKKLDV